MNQNLMNKLPLRVIHNVTVQMRNLHFNVPKPDVEGFFIQPSIELGVIEDALVNKYHFEDGTLPSYKYHGEDLNLRAPWGFDGEGRFMQLHARFFEQPDGSIEILVHYEPSPLQHPDDHYHERGFSWNQGREKFGPILEELDMI